MEINFSFNRSLEIIDEVSTTFSEFESNCPTIVFSDEIPPLLAGKNNEIEKFPVCGLLGEYCLRTKKIIIYLQGINFVHTKLGSNPQSSKLYQNLLKIVIIHELGHYWHYTCMNKSNYEGSICDEEFSEWIAQMFTMFCLSKYKTATEILFNLSKNQPDIYKSFVDFKIMFKEHFYEIVRELWSSYPSEITFYSPGNETIKFLFSLYTLKEENQNNMIEILSSLGDISYNSIKDNKDIEIIKDRDSYNI
ncbi:hypothetical protein [uncultured Draconibacterium sp.]|uniref:hypothetical protein n=1 Tax=uncultured Draconibacterium sp. TaxID=1573823 RepID=UPI0025F74C55|nr:hypothetical protein [uncultured Draconibacterium sp.]